MVMQVNPAANRLQENLSIPIHSHPPSILVHLPRWDLSRREMEVQSSVPDTAKRKGTTTVLDFSSYFSQSPWFPCDKTITLKASVIKKRGFNGIWTTIPRSLSDSDTEEGSVRVSPSLFMSSCPLSLLLLLNPSLPHLFHTLS